MNWRKIGLGILLAITVTVGAWVIVGFERVSALFTPQVKEARVERTTFVSAMAEPTVRTPSDSQQNAADESTPRVEHAPVRDILIELPAQQTAPSAQAPAGTVPVYGTFDFLRGYLTNRAYPVIIETKPWTNGSINYQQYREELGGVSYWDFWSEHENWDSPSYLFQDDAGKWQPYRTEMIRNAAGQELAAYVLVDRKGPGAMDKIWFTQDAVWMLETEKSKNDVGPIRNMDELVEWGNLDKLGNFRVEVDDRIMYDGAIVDWFSGKALGLTPELAQILTWRHREFGSSGTIIPILYQRHLRVLVYGGSKKPKWFMATGVRLTETTRVKAFSLNDFPRAEMTRLAQNVLKPETYIATLDPTRTFDLQVQPGAPSTIRFNGAGTLGAMQFLIPKKYDPKLLWLRVKYGDETGHSAGVDLPWVAFFSDPKQLALHRSTPLGVVESEDAYIFYSNLPLPFQNGMTLEIATKSAEPLLLTAGVAASAETTNTQLRVLYRETEKLAMYGPDYQVKLPEDGKLVGLVLTTEEQDLDKIPKIFAPGKTNEEDPVKRAWPMGYLEGNLFLFDGAGNSRLYGGHEDWADGGFYFNRGYTTPSGGSNRPFGGILRYKDGKDGYATVFRYFNDLSAFRFKNGLTMNFGHGTWKNNFPVKFGVTVYYYKSVVSNQYTSKQLLWTSSGWLFPKRCSFQLPCQTASSPNLAARVDPHPFANRHVAKIRSVIGSLAIHDDSRSSPVSDRRGSNRSENEFRHTVRISKPLQ